MEQIGAWWNTKIIIDLTGDRTQICSVGATRLSLASLSLSDEGEREAKRCCLLYPPHKHNYTNTRETPVSESDSM